MKVVIGGGTGFIGSHLVRALHTRGDQVTVLALNAARAQALVPPGVEVVEWRPPALGSWTSALNGADAVINMAGHQVVSPMQPWTAAEKAKILNSRVEPTRALVEAIRAADPRPRLLVNQSAIGYYGSQGDTVLTESSAAGHDFMADVVKQWEAAARPVEELGVRLVLLRTAVVLGETGLLPLFTLPFKLGFGGVMGRPKQWFSWIHIDDEVELIVHALTHDDLAGPVNASSPQPVTMDRFSHELGAVLHRPVWVPFISAGMRLGLGQRSQAVLASQRVLPEKALASGYLFRHPQSDEALRSLLAAPASDGPSL